MTITGNVANGLSGWALEASGLPTSAIRDATSPAVGAGTSTAPASNALSNVTASAIFVSSYADNGGPGGTYTPNAGWTDVVGGVTMLDNANPNGGLLYQIVSATGSKTAGWTVDFAPTWACGIAVYKSAPATGNIPPGLGPVVGMEQLFHLDASLMR